MKGGAQMAARVERGLGVGAEPGEPADIATGVMDLGRADMDPSRCSVLGAGQCSAALVYAFPAAGALSGLSIPSAWLGGWKL
ncbi:hypothetical protein Stube_26640 [Streptomyces tubercidicus]|uniref:Uncharacterized protein n=1 Tax=Streptomyces tubercidicus TaxID=47759 RepID=A0A640UTJ0_9ACTN|nr:hypothetical protein Stube_26640 [Streptomyces tubercidicus]